jgi:hypothetical protein
LVWKVRRVLTGHDSSGKSIIMTDGIAPNVLEMASMPGLALTDLWETKGSPASNDGIADAAARPVHLEPPKTLPRRWRDLRQNDIAAVVGIALEEAREGLKFRR